MGEGDFFQGKGVKNLNWEILTKNLVTFKRCNEVKDQELYGGSLWGGGEGACRKKGGGGDTPISQSICYKV